MSYFTMMGLRTPYDLHRCLSRIVNRYNRETTALMDTLKRGVGHTNYWLASGGIGYMELNSAANEAMRLLSWLDGSEDAKAYFVNEEDEDDLPRDKRETPPPVAQQWMLHVVGYAMTFDSYQRVSSRSTSVAGNLMEDCAKAFKEQLRSALPSDVVMEYAVAVKKAEEDRIAKWREESEARAAAIAIDAAAREAVKNAARRERRAVRKNRQEAQA